MGRRLNVTYACTQGFFWMFYGVVGSFASVFLLARGYTNAEIGIILSVANILAVVIQPPLADFADRSKRWSLTGITQLMTVIMMVLTAGLCILQRKTLALAVIFLLLVAWHTAVQPLLNSLSFKLASCGVQIHFGIARSVGSLCYSVMVGIMGTAVARCGATVLPVSGEAILVLLMLSLVLTKRQFDRMIASRASAGAVQTIAGAPEQAAPTIADGAGGPPQESEEIDLMAFLRRNRLFVLLNLGVAGVYFSNQILNNYMIQVVNAVGGDSADMGRILSLMAFLEIPPMVCFDMLRKRFSCQTMLKVAAVGFTVKIALCWLATSVFMVYVAQLFQLVSFGLFLPAMVHFIDEVMRRGEAVKGQAFFTTMVTVTTIVASFAGGMILDVSGARMLTLTATVVTALGAVVILLCVDRVRKADA